MASEQKLIKIWVKRAHRGPMDPKQEVRLQAGRGIHGSADQGGKRQVTVLSREAWENAEQELGARVDPVARRANLLVTGVDLEMTRGRVLRIGSARILIHGETRPCERMEEAHTGLRSALADHWRAGAFGEVLEDAEIQVGDPVGWEDAAPS